MADDGSYVKIRLIDTRENIAKGFYLLMTNGNTHSDVKNEFTIEKRFVKLLEENKIKFETVEGR